ncbi:Monothiol glutaredoxin-S7, chloroplastic [Turnera subulata]|uniref:Monothiol glutaredoxin-S7, chloroplastic n=1 Tax=Turnera subulata TaxID=218843 RepID=A0A9Q0JNC8_9ROSI|nr:Monothiol glutaredoxin-S7, chloroplastic [Turnera subulata]
MKMASRGGVMISASTLATPPSASSLSTGRAASPRILTLPHSNSRLLVNHKPKSKSKPSAISPIRCGLSPQLKTTLDKVVSSHKVVLFMKGTKDFPQCGFSNNVVQILRTLNVPFEAVNILENEALRQGLKDYSSWPTFPQLYIDGEFFGGCDITLEAYKSGELQEVLEKALCS